MEILYSTEAGFGLGDDLLNFTLEGDDAEPKTVVKGSSASTSSLESSKPTTTLSQQTRSGSSPKFVEEELEWLSNKDAFPALETCFGILSDNSELLLNHQSPVSVLENSSSSSNSNNNGNTNSNGNGCTLANYCDSPKVPANFPARARSKKPRRKRSGFGEFPSQQCISFLLNQVNIKNRQEPLLPPLATRGAGLGRRCLHCQAEKTPQWRAGPMGPKTLCNACGVRYKSGRLLPEYRPANSPMFSSALHSNSHKKVVEMRRKKQLGIAGYEASGCRIG